MRKTPDLAVLRADARSRAARGSDRKTRVMSGNGMTITAASAGAPADPDTLLRSSATESLCGGTARAVPGGVQAAVTSSRLVRTVALSDGTRIVFAAVETTQEIESL
jgi:hypothetical protein